jgi:RND family efflux transporter MFP subunit
MNENRSQVLHKEFESDNAKDRQIDIEKDISMTSDQNSVMQQQRYMKNTAIQKDSVSAHAKASAIQFGQYPRRWIGQAHENFRKSSRRIKATIIASILVALILLGAVGYTIFHDSYLLKYMPPVTVLQVGQPRDITYSINASGLVSIKQKFNVTFNTTGRVTVSQLLVNPGDKVQAGQPLLKLDPSQIQAQITLAQRTVNADQSYLNSVSNATPYNGITVANAQRALQLAQNQYNALISQINLHDSDLISEYEGTVLSVAVNPGDSINPNQTLITIGDLSAVQIQAKLPISLRQQVQPNTTAQIITPDGTTLQGKIASIVPVVDPQTDTFTVNVATDSNPNQILWPNMIASIRLPLTIHAYVIPQISVLNPSHESAIYVLRNGHVYLKQVHVVDQSPDGTSYYVDNGITPNDQIIILPLNRLHEGMPVTVQSIEH